MSDIAVREAQPRQAAGLSQAEKAAIILCLLDRDGAAPLFGELGEAALLNFVRVMAQIGTVDGQTVESVVAEFVAALENRGRSVQCGARTALGIIENNLGQAVAASITDTVGPLTERDIWKRVAMMTPSVIADFMADEHPQLAVAILTKLPPEYTGRVLNEFPQEEARRIARFCRSMKGAGTRSTAIIGEALDSFPFSRRRSASTLTMAERMGAIMNHAASEVRDDLIEQLDALDAKFSEEVRRSMFTFADIDKRVARNDVSKIVKAVDSAVLVKALVGAGTTAPATKTFILSNISTRMAEMIAQEIKDAGAIKRKDSEKAQAEVVAAIVALVRAGEIELVTDDD